MVDPVSLTILAKLLLILKQYAILIPITRKGLFQLIRESRQAKSIELKRAESFKGRVPAGEWYIYVMIRYFIELGFYLVLLHSIFGIHTLGAALLFCLEDWALYWLTIAVPFFFANRWQQRIGMPVSHPRFIDILVDPAVAVQDQITEQVQPEDGSPRVVEYVRVREGE